MTRPKMWFLATEENCHLSEIKPKVKLIDSVQLKVLNCDY